MEAPPAPPQPPLSFGLSSSRLLTWNGFQRLCKGRRMTKQEMSAAWQQHKATTVPPKMPAGPQQQQKEQVQQQQPPGTASRSTEPKSGSVQATLTAWLRASGGQRQHSSGGAAAENSRDAVPAAADDAQAHVSIGTAWHTPDKAASAASRSPVSALTPSSTRSMCSVRSTPPPLWQFRGSAAGTPSSDAASVPSEASLSPCVGPTPADLASLRVAVHQLLLSGQKAAPGEGSSERDHLVSGDAASKQQQQGPPAANAAAAASVGCFGFSSSRLTWNGFQRLCKGRRMTKQEISAAWRQYKATGVPPPMPAGLQQDQVQQLEQVQQQEQVHQQQQQEQMQQQQAQHTAWGAFKGWCSRTASRAASRVASRAASRVASPSSSPVCKAGPQKQWHQHAELGEEQQQLQDLLEQQLQEAEQAEHAAAAAAPPPPLQQQPQQQPCSSTWRLPTSSSEPCALPRATPHAAVAAAIAGGGRRPRELVADNCPGLLQAFSTWRPAEPSQLRQLKRAMPAKAGLYEFGLRLPTGACTLQHSSALAAAAVAGIVTLRVPYPGQPGQQQQQQQQQQSNAAEQGGGPVVCFYLGKAGSLRGGRGETLRTRFNKYALTSAGRLGPVREPAKDALFAQLQELGQLCIRWCVLESEEPCDAERRLLEQLDYAANVLHNGGRRPLMLG